MRSSQLFPVLTSKSSSQELPFEARKLEEMEEEMLDKYEQAHSYNSYQIIWVVSGTGTQWIDLRKFDIEDNKVFFIRPGQTHSIYLSNDIKGFIFSFAESFLSIIEPQFDLPSQAHFLQLLNEANGVLIRDDMLTDMLEIADKVMKEYENIYSFKNEILKRYLKIFLILLVRHFEESFELVVQTRTGELVQNFIKLLDKHFREKKMVSDYAEQLFVTPNYLNEIIKRNTGHSVGYHIRKRIAYEAERMALHSQLSMKEIGYDLGFSDPAHFSKFFKANCGTNFSDFKKEKMLAIAV